MAKLDFGGFVLVGPDGVIGQMGDFKLPGPPEDLDDDFGFPIEALLGRLIMPDLFGELDFGEPRRVKRIPVAEEFISNLRQRGNLNLRESRKLRLTDSLGRYNRKTEEIEICPINTFHTDEEFYRVCFHEIGHWTGRYVDRTADDAIIDKISAYIEQIGWENLSKREDRELSRRVKTLRAKEEMVAERVAAKIVEHLGLDTQANKDFSYGYLEKYGTELMVNSDIPLNAHLKQIDQEVDRAVAYLLRLQHPVINPEAN